MRIELTTNDIKVQYTNFCLNKYFGTYLFIISFLEFLNKTLLSVVFIHSTLLVLFLFSFVLFSFVLFSIVLFYSSFIRFYILYFPISTDGKRKEKIQLKVCSKKKNTTGKAWLIWISNCFCLGWIHLPHAPQKRENPVLVVCDCWE